MLTSRELFLQHNAQTSFFPLLLEIEKAKGIYMWDVNGKRYTDMISGIGVSNIGHCHPAVVKAVRNQLNRHLHLMVYGEFVQYPQVKLASALSKCLPESLQSVYFVNSGAEAIDGAMKLAKRYTQRSEIIYFRNAYHGSTQGPLSIMGNENMKKPFRPLLPGNTCLEFNDSTGLEQITTRTAAVFIEPIQGEAGVQVADSVYMQKLADRCRSTGTLLVADEIQTGFGRTGKLFAFEHYQIIPDILCMSKGMGGGMPVGAFLSSREIMSSLSHQPALGHITTFGGHPVCCAAAMACLQVVNNSRLLRRVEIHEKRVRKILRHRAITAIRGKGLMLAVQFDTFEINKLVIDECIRRGVITDWFLFCDHAMRLAPPLTITTKQLEESCHIIMEAIIHVCGQP